MKCDMEFIGPVGEDEDIWRCCAHRYNFFSKRGVEPSVCPRADDPTTAREAVSEILNEDGYVDTLHLGC